MTTIDVYVETRNRRASDVASGLELKRENWPDYSDDELVRHFEMFQHYDLDSSGFITPDNLLEVLQAMEVADVNMDTVRSIISEVAILTGHDNDGKLSFRDYMHAIRYDRGADEHNAALEAEVERRLSVAEAEPEPEPVGQAESVSLDEPATETEIESKSKQEPEPEPEPEEPVRARRTSMSALNTLAASRIKAFQSIQSVAAEAMAREKLSAFRTKPIELDHKLVNSDDMHKETLRNKVKAFEVAATWKGEVELKKTWRKVGGKSSYGNYTPGQKLMLAGKPVGVAPKKKLSDLP